MKAPLGQGSLFAVFTAVPSGCRRASGTDVVNKYLFNECVSWSFSQVGKPRPREGKWLAQGFVVEIQLEMGALVLPASTEPVPGSRKPCVYLVACYSVVQCPETGFWVGGGGTQHTEKEAGKSSALLWCCQWNKENG